MIDQIGADGIVTLQLRGDEDLRADAVGRGDQRAFRVARKTKESGETADAIDLFVGGASLREGSGIGHALVSGGDVHAGTGVAVGEGFFLLTRILTAFRHRLAVVHRSKGSPCKFVLLTMRRSP